MRCCRDAGQMIMLVDELDAVARHRVESHETTSRLVSILLSEMDGLAELNQVFLVGSANNLESIDRAVLDRFDLKIEFGLPDRNQLHAALTYSAKHLSTDYVAEASGATRRLEFPQDRPVSGRGHTKACREPGLNVLEAGEPPLPRKEDYLARFAGFH